MCRHITRVVTVCWFRKDIKTRQWCTAADTTLFETSIVEEHSIYITTAAAREPIASRNLMFDSNIRQRALGAHLEPRTKKICVNKKCENETKTLGNQFSIKNLLSKSPGMGEGGDWWSWPKGVRAKGILRGCQGLLTLCPWDTHYQFSIKTLLSKNSKLVR